MCFPDIHIVFNGLSTFILFQISLSKQVEEMEQDNLITLNVERLLGTYGRVTVQWMANGSISDIFPVSGTVCNNIAD